MPSPATRQTGAGSPASRISNRRSGSSTWATTAKRRKTSPIRFVCGCENGHLQDIDWRRVVHQNFRGQGGAEPPALPREMWQEDAGTSADPRDTKISATAAHPCRWRSFSAWPPRPMPRRTALDRRPRSEPCDAPKGFACSREARPTPTFRRSRVWSRCRRPVDELCAAYRGGLVCRWRNASRSKTSRLRAGSIRRVRANLSRYSDEEVLAGSVDGRRRPQCKRRCGGGPKDRGIPIARERQAPLIGDKQPRRASSCRDAGSAALGSGPRSGMPAESCLLSPSIGLREVACLVWLHAVRARSAAPTISRMSVLRSAALRSRRRRIGFRPVEQFGEGIFLAILT